MKKRKGIHFAREDNSARLQRVMKMLRRGGAYTTRQIIEGAHVAAVSAIISELRKNGHNIGCFVKTVRGQRRWFYMLEGEI